MKNYIDSIAIEVKPNATIKGNYQSLIKCLTTSSELFFHDKQHYSHGFLSILEEAGLPDILHNNIMTYVHHWSAIFSLMIISRRLEMETGVFTIRPSSSIEWFKDDIKRSVSNFASEFRNYTSLLDQRVYIGVSHLSKNSSGIPESLRLFDHRPVFDNAIILVTCHKDELADLIESAESYMLGGKGYIFYPYDKE